MGIANNSITSQVRVKLVKSLIGRLQSHKDCIRGLGLKKIGQNRTLVLTPSVMGMINKVSYLLDIEYI